jgi:hypothetical protein
MGMTQWYYAKGGQQHGPVPQEELLNLLRSGALDSAKDLVWNPTMKDWLPASQLAELSVGAPPATDVSQPFAYPTASGDFTEIPPGSEPLIPNACVKRAFDLTVRHIGPILLITILYTAISFGLSMALVYLDKAMGWTPLTDMIMEKAGATPDAISTYQSGSENELSLQSNVISMLFSVFFMLGLTRIGLNIVSGKPFGVGMMFSGGKWLLKGFLAQWVFMIMLVAGTILFVVPGVIVLLRFGMYQAAIVDRNMGIIGSLGYSWELTKGNGANLFVILLFGILIVLAGCIAMLVGMLFAFPMMFLMWIVAYRWMQYGGRAVMDDPSTQQPLLAALPD